MSDFISFKNMAFELDISMDTVLRDRTGQGNAGWAGSCCNPCVMEYPMRC